MAVIGAGAQGSKAALKQNGQIVHELRVALYTSKRRFGFALTFCCWAARCAPAAQAQSPDAEACGPRFLLPVVGAHAADHNGVHLGPVCFNSSGSDEDRSHHVFVIGDWGGVIEHPGRGPRTADHRSREFAQHRTFVHGADDLAQHRVAAQMRHRAATHTLDYVINAGDSFYWGGIEAGCGRPLRCADCDPVGQWQAVFEDMYSGDSLEGKQWLGVLGNHDYGGFSFMGAWDQIIGYTWGGPQSSGRWLIPAQFWSTTVFYFDRIGSWSVDYFFVDSNVHGAQFKLANQGHNICSLMHNGPNATCGEQGPTSADDCPRWFRKLWVEQIDWLQNGLAGSAADWQVVVTHYPPEFAGDEWSYLASTYGIDLLISGHRHSQEVHGPDDLDNFLRPTAYLVSGGGGGITSESLPEIAGEDDAYGFMDLTMYKEFILVEAISHGGHRRQSAKVRQRAPSFGVNAGRSFQKFDSRILPTVSHSPALNVISAAAAAPPQSAWSSRDMVSLLDATLGASGNRSAGSLGAGVQLRYV